MEIYIKELLLFNSAYNLVNTDNHDEIVVRHILDSLSAVNLISEAVKSIGTGGTVSIADIGSGGGLPGIPLACAMPECHFTLVERMSKRCAFLENEIAILGLKNTLVKNIELEKVFPESFDIATFRAFRPLDKKMLKALLMTLRKGGTLAAYKAKSENIETEMTGCNCPKDFYKVMPLQVPFLTDSGKSDDRERNLVFIAQNFLGGTSGQV